MPMTENRARELAASIEAAYLEHTRRFAEITARACHRFEEREWQGGQWDAAERLMLYKISVDQTVAGLRGAAEELGPDAGGRVKAAYAARIAGRADAELAETFFNSVVRRLFGMVGLNPELEFFDTEAEHASTPGERPVHRAYPVAGDPAGTFRRILADVRVDAHFRSLDADADQVAVRVDEELRARGVDAPAEVVEVLPLLFFRNKAAYLVGRVRAGAEEVPLVLALEHTAAGIAVDGVLTTTDEVSVVFGFTRSYFHVETDRPRAVVDFLREIMPHRRVDEMYTAIGYHKHGKRELFRELQAHLADPAARFEFAEGKKGLVMIVFTLPSFNVVFKVIRDVFGPTKETSRRDVEDRYRMVFLHDRVGRLADAQEFEMLEFRKGCFAPEVLDELLRDAPTAVEVGEETVVVQHLYTERRVTPLDIFLRDADPEAARAAVVEYGDAMRDLAAANIFPGDMLLKNFGVTRHGRVIFYDYDELRLLTECNFRRIPEPRDPWDEMSAEPWFHVGEADVFPEEFLPFLVPLGPLRDTFLQHHGELLDVDFWRRMQERQKAGEVIDFYPYRAERRLRGAATDG